MVDKDEEQYTYTRKRIIKELAKLGFKFRTEQNANLFVTHNGITEKIGITIDPIHRSVGLFSSIITGVSVHTGYTQSPGEVGIRLLFDGLTQEKIQKKLIEFKIKVEEYGRSKIQQKYKEQQKLHTLKELQSKIPKTYSSIIVQNMKYLDKYEVIVKYLNYEQVEKVLKSLK